MSEPRDTTPTGEELIPTVRLAAVTGAQDVTASDPTEDYHEASRMYPGVIDPAVLGAARLERSLAMRVSATRSVKRHQHRPFVALPDAELGVTTLATALAARRSIRTFGTRQLRLEELSAVLAAGYGVSAAVDGTPQSLRTAPSGGALYPLELYVACQRVEGLDLALYHYDPLRHGLELLRPLTTGEALEQLSPYHELLATSAAFVAITAMLWRSRFKYGARAYRFTLIEAGHAAQSILLAVAALGLAAVPIGGFYDRQVDAWLGVDDLYEPSLYLIPIGAALP